MDKGYEFYGEISYLVKYTVPELLCLIEQIHHDMLVQLEDIHEQYQEGAPKTGPGEITE